VAGKLLRDGLVEEISSHNALTVWRLDEDKGALALSITRICADCSSAVSSARRIFSNYLFKRSQSPIFSLQDAC
jgi:hypothetical protein